MKTNKGLSRRELLKLSGLALGGLAVSGSAAKTLAAPAAAPLNSVPVPIEQLPPPGQMRITFCGSWYTPRPNQACNSVFVELGNETNDSFVFDCGAGVVAKYVALGVPYSRMEKIFLTHLHGDHMSDLTTIYCFGPASDRKTPLHVYGPSGDTKNEGTWFFCKTLVELCKWHRESFSFLPTGYADDGDGYDLVPHELRYMKNPGIAYENNGVKVSHFPAIHARDGGISYKLEWTWNGEVRSMVFSGDTKPNTYMLENAQGVDVLIHEMATPPDIWVTRETGLEPGDDGYLVTLAINTEVIANSHTEQTALGYILSKTNPRLGVATHFPNDPDLVDPAKADVLCFWPGEFIVAQDLQVITIEADKTINHYMAAATEYPWIHTMLDPGRAFAPAKYDGPLAQFNDELIDHIIPVKDYISPGPFCKP